MKTLVISYSLTGNNDALAKGIASELGAKHFRVSESGSRTNAAIALDIFFNRTPKVPPLTENVQDYDLIVFVAPVWMGHVASPLRAYFPELKGKLVNYAFASISGGADGVNPNLAAELYNRTGREAVALIDQHIAELLPATPKPTRKDTSAYRLTEGDVKKLTAKAVAAIQKTFKKAESSPFT